ncbi:MAG: hypothetical protein WDO16_13025 [Bacteroidota bacterium]
MKSIADMPRWADILVISLGVYVGVIVLQQLAQLRQAVSGQTFFSVSAASLSRPRGGFFSRLVRNLRKDLL